MNTYLAREIVKGYDNLEQMRDYIIRTIRILTNAVEMTDEPSNNFRASYLGYSWFIKYTNTGHGKSWSISCSRSIPNNGNKTVFIMESACIIPDDCVCGMYGTMDELTSMFTSYFPKISSRLEVLRYASTIRI